MIEIQYEVRERDLIAFNLYLLRRAEPLQKALRRHQVVVPGIIMAIALFNWFYMQNSLAALFTFGIGLAWGLLSPVYMRWTITRQLRRLYTEEQKVAALGPQKLRVAPDALVELRAGGETRIPWKEILRLETSKKYLFLFLDLDTALIVPRETVTAGDLHEFIKAVDSRIE